MQGENSSITIFVGFSNVYFISEAENSTKENFLNDFFSLSDSAKPTLKTTQGCVQFRSQEVLTK